MTHQDWIYESLCYYDLRNPNGVKNVVSIYDEDEVASLGNNAKPDCCCDNCFYGRAKMAEYIISNCIQNHIKL
jgi:hypothetical protein